MNMICHYTPGEHFHPFFFLTIMQTVEYNLLILVSCKDIKPLNNCKAYKINSFRIVKFIVSAHLELI